MNMNTEATIETLGLHHNESLQKNKKYGFFHTFLTPDVVSELVYTTLYVTRIQK